MYNFYSDNTLWIQDIQGCSKQLLPYFSVKRGLKQPSKGYSSPDAAAMAYLVLSNFWNGTTLVKSMPAQSFWPDNRNFIHKIINSANI